MDGVMIKIMIALGGDYIDGVGWGRQTYLMDVVGLMA